MGNDIGWHGRQESRELQGECRAFLERFARELGLEYEVFDGPVRGNFIDESRENYYALQRKGGIEALFPHLKRAREERGESAPGRREFRTPFSKQLDLAGIRIFPLGRELDRESSFGLQLSFVFENSNAGTIIRLRDEDEGSNCLEYYRKKHGKRFDPDLPTYEVREGGEWRALGESRALIYLLCVIREWYVPSLTFSDEYGIAEEFDEAERAGEMGIPRGIEERDSFTREVLLALKKHLPWHHERASFSLMPAYWPRWLEYCDRRKGADVRSIDTLARLCPPDERERLQSVGIEALLFLDSMTSTLLQSKGFRTIGGILAAGSEVADMLADEADRAAFERLSESLGFLIEVLWKELTEEERASLMAATDRTS